MRPREPKLPTFVPDKGFTVEEWLAVEDVTDERYEFHDGKLVSVRAMAGGTYRHAMLMGNFIGKMDAALSDPLAERTECHVLSSDLRLGVQSGTRYFYPDAAVVCGQPQFDEVVPSAVVNPVLVCEVLSKSSAVFDSFEKFDFYARLESLCDYVLISQFERRVEVRSRPSATEPWRYAITTLPAEDVVLPGLGHRLPMAGLYRGFDQAPQG